MRRIALIAAAAIVLAACDADDLDARVADLEQELDQAAAENEELLAENERLHDEIANLTADAEPGNDAAEEDADNEVPENDASGPTSEPADLFTPEGLVEQLRTLFEQPADADLEWEPGTTDWVDADLPPVDGEHATPGALAADLAAALTAESLGIDAWETTTRVLLDDDPDTATIAVLVWGLADDAGAGFDVRVPVSQADGTWTIDDGAEERFHCRRGVTDDDLCV